MNLYFAICPPTPCVDSDNSRQSKIISKLMRPKDPLSFRILRIIMVLQEILAGFMVKNLDTGETTNLKDAEKQLPKGVDPLVLHIMERTKDFPR